MAAVASVWQDKEDNEKKEIGGIFFMLLHEWVDPDYYRELPDQVRDVIRMGIKDESNMSKLTNGELKWWSDGPSNALSFTSMGGILEIIHQLPGNDKRIKTALAKYPDLLLGYKVNHKIINAAKPKRGGRFFALKPKANPEPQKAGSWLPWPLK